MPVVLSARLQEFALAPVERVSLFTRGITGFKAWYDEAFAPKGGECDCGRPGTHTSGGNPECDDCKAKNEIIKANPQQFHPCDLLSRWLTTEEWEEAEEHMREVRRQHSRNRRLRMKVNDTIDSETVVCQSEASNDSDR